jgi:hypothetical protein
MSAYEYEAPTTIFGSLSGFLSEELRAFSLLRVRQKGEVELRHVSNDCCEEHLESVRP